jgi:hypothetical protein
MQYFPISPRFLLSFPLLAGILLLTACDSGGPSAEDPGDDPDRPGSSVSSEQVIDRIENRKWAVVYAEAADPSSSLDTYDFDCPAVVDTTTNPSREVVEIGEGAESFTLHPDNDNALSLLGHPLDLTLENIQEGQEGRFEFVLRQQFNNDDIVYLEIGTRNDTLRFYMKPGLTGLNHSHMNDRTGYAVLYEDCFDRPFDPADFDPES